jgi:methyl coenzyme M reductase alpha subunit
MKDKYLDFPIKKIFKEDFVNKKGKVIFTLEYEQATLEEYFEFNQKSEEEQGLEIYNLVHQKIPLTIFERFLKLFFPHIC